MPSATALLNADFVPVHSASVHSAKILALAYLQYMKYSHHQCVFSLFYLKCLCFQTLFAYFL